MTRNRKIPLVLLILTQPICVAIYQYLAKSIGTHGAAETLFSAVAHLTTLPGFWSLLAVEAVSLVVWLSILQRVGTAAAFPLTACSYVLIFILSIFVFHEMVGMETIWGSILIVAGMGLLAFEEDVG